MEEEKTIEGFSIPFRKLTEEEASRPITLERFIDFHHKAGEDFIDQIGTMNSSQLALIFAGYAMAKHPEFIDEILEQCNRHMVYTQLIQQVYDAHDDQGNGDLFYSDFADFLNLTIIYKKRANQVLIQVAEYYANE